MKSIIEQASSIMKAIEKAWNQAEQPKEFSIKIFEKEERNFFGMSVKPAKIGIFFGDKPTTYEKPSSRPRSEIKECRSSFGAQSSSPRPSTEQHKAAEELRKSSKEPHKTPFTKETKSTLPHPKHVSKPLEHKTEIRPKQTNPRPHTTTHEKLHRVPTSWSDVMITTTHNWIKEILALTNMTSVDFNSEVIGKNLKLTFNAPLSTSPMHEKQLFRSFAHLIMSSLRNQYKQEIRDLKVILTRPE